MTWDDFERVLCWIVFKSAWGSPISDEDWEQLAPLQAQYLARWPR